MFSRQIVNIVKLSRNKLSHVTSVCPLSTSSAKLSEKQLPEKPFEDKLTANKALKEEPIKQPWTEQQLTDNERVQWTAVLKELKKEPLFEINADNKFFKFFQQDVRFNPDSMKAYLIKNVFRRQRELQQFNLSRQQILGYDLALAHFLCFMGGRVKFRGQDMWFGKDDVPQLPDKFDINYVVSEVDATGVMLHFEGLQNLTNATKITRVTFARSIFFDDWFVDKLSATLPLMEYLDISNNPKVTSRSMEALYRSANLKHLVITNYEKTAAFELTCMMLEDVLPELKIEIKEPEVDKKIKSKQSG